MEESPPFANVTTAMLAVLQEQAKTMVDLRRPRADPIALLAEPSEGGSNGGTGGARRAVALRAMRPSFERRPRNYSQKVRKAMSLTLGIAEDLPRA